MGKSENDAGGETLPEAMARIWDGAPEPELTPIQRLILDIEAHDTAGAEIQTRMTALGIDAKGIKKIRRAKEEADRAKATLDALIAGGMVSG